VTEISETATWRELAVARSLDSARSRAEQRVQRFLDAAVELMNAKNGKDFTVQEVVERSGQSLRSFYQYFGGKHELLLALFEEAIRTTADHLAAFVEHEPDAGERVRLFVIEYYRVCSPSATAKQVGSKQFVQAPLLAEFAQQLLTSHPSEAARAFQPLASGLRDLLREAMAQGSLRSDLEVDEVVGILLGAVMFHVFAATIAGTPVPKDDARAAERLWDALSHGLLADRA
jgi:AcrR family transcriptional regulator